MRGDSDVESVKLLHLVNNCLESFGMIHSEVGEDLAVDIDTGSMKLAHELRVGKALETGCSVDTGDPEGTEVVLLVTTIAECIRQTFFPCVFSNGPHILAGTEITSRQMEDLLASVTRRYVIYRSWHT